MISRYYGPDAQIVVEETTNGQDADAAPGPQIAIGDAVDWVYTVTNPGKVELDTISVTDDMEGVIAGPDSGDSDGVDGRFPVRRNGTRPGRCRLPGSTSSDSLGFRLAAGGCFVLLALAKRRREDAERS
jgi:hypothetical protein